MAALNQFQLWCGDELYLVEAETIEQAKKGLINDLATRDIAVQENQIEEIDATPLDSLEVSSPDNSITDQSSLDATDLGMRYEVRVDENSHYMDESARYSAGFSEDCETAKANCRRIVDEFLLSSYRKGMSAEHLLMTYKSFGEDPWISSTDDDCKFSAWDYAEQRCEEICRGD